APGIHSSGTSDLVLGDRKVSGNAQQRKRRFLLHHGTLLYAFAGGRVARYLKQPARQPDYRQGRSHADFLVNINAPVEDLKARLCSEWQPVEKVTAWPVAETKKLVESKYRLDEWLHRR
ncbi:MAG: biotin/lipoate A/B protein ligase family protein, partial [Gemmataceae bacterium]